MSSAFELRPYAAADEPAIVGLWNEAMWADPIDAITWRSRYLLDPNFDANECLVAVDRADDRVVGFVLGMSAKSEVEHLPVPPVAWIVAFGVGASHRRQGLARHLFGQLESHWRDAGIRQIQVGPYIPGYVSPGVDEHAYPEAIEFLSALGADTASRPLSMKASLTGYRQVDSVPDTAARLGSEGIVIRPVEPADILPLLQFLDQHFAHWRGDATGVLLELFGSDPRYVTMHVAEENGTIIGYAQSRAERFGPFGVNDAYRGRGIGAVLLSRTLIAMRARGFHCAWFLWTSDRAAKLYREHGFEEVRRFALTTITIQHSGDR